MNPAATQSVVIGHEIEPVTYAITRESIATYSRYVFGGRDTRNIHTDDEIAQRAGLPRAVAQGQYSIGFLSEVALAFFGAGWVRGVRLDVSLIKPIYPGDFITLRGMVSDYRAVASGTRITLDVWIENQSGERVTVGWISGMAQASRQPGLNVSVALPPAASARRLEARSRA